MSKDRPHLPDLQTVTDDIRSGCATPESAGRILSLFESAEGWRVLAKLDENLRKTLQRNIGTKDDGRLGDDTVRRLRDRKNHATPTAPSSEAALLPGDDGFQPPQRPWSPTVSIASSTVIAPEAPVAPVSESTEELLTPWRKPRLIGISWYSGPLYSITCPISGVVGTGYYPTRPGDPHHELEGWSVDALGNNLNTLEDFFAGKCQYVSISMDDRVPKGTLYMSAELNAHYADKLAKMHLKAIPLIVCDTGDHFEGKGMTAFDICTRNEQASLKDYINRPHTLFPYHPDGRIPEGPIIAASRIKQPTQVVSRDPIPMTMPAVEVADASESDAWSSLGAAISSAFH